MKRLRLEGITVAVTGAANGIGAAIAQELARAGARVALGDLDLAAVEQTANRIGFLTKGFVLDVTNSDSFINFLDMVEKSWGDIDVLVNNAGVMWVGAFSEEPEMAVERQIAVNLVGAMRGVKLLAPRMASRGGGHIITIASAASKLAPAGEATYAATKHGIYGYLSAVRSELRGSGVNISVVMPGVVETELASGTESGAVRRLRPEEVASAVLKTVRKPRFETVLPARILLIHKIIPLFPQKIRDYLLGKLLPDQVAAIRGGKSRKKYESTHLKNDKWF
ncbi:MAG: SDR family NAD(P)-dependent oxidoreductase [Mycobacteriaceae bacterium]